MPERSVDAGRPAAPQRVFSQELERGLDACLDAEFGVFTWFQALNDYFVYFSAAARERSDFVKVRERAKVLFVETPGVSEVYDVDQARDMR